MCDAATIAIATVALSALSTYSAYDQQMSAAEAQNKYRAENAHNANKAAAYQMNAENERMLQEGHVLSDELRKVSSKSKQEMGRAVASSGSAGMNLSMLEREFLQVEGMHRAALEEEHRWKERQNIHNLYGYSTQARDRINSVQGAQCPSMLGALATVGASGIGAYGTYQNDVKKQDKKG